MYLEGLRREMQWERFRGEMNIETDEMYFKEEMSWEDGQWTMDLEEMYCTEKV